MSARDLLRPQTQGEGERTLVGAGWGPALFLDWRMGDPGRQAPHGTQCPFLHASRSRRRPVTLTTLGLPSPQQLHRALVRIKQVRECQALGQPAHSRRSAVAETVIIIPAFSSQPLLLK